jgi:hypothetical protein
MTRVSAYFLSFCQLCVEVQLGLHIVRKEIRKDYGKAASEMEYHSILDHQRILNTRVTSKETQSEQ